jgi:hypothetical protein
MVRYVRKTVFAIILAAFMGILCGFAQSWNRSVRGVVTDREGQPLASSVVNIEDMRTLAIRSFITGRDGAYYFIGLSTERDYMIRARHGDVWGRPKTLSCFDERKEPTVNLKIDVLKEK